MPNGRTAPVAVVSPDCRYTSEVWTLGEAHIDGFGHIPFLSKEVWLDDDAPPFSFVKIDGTVTLHDDLDEVRRFATVIGGRYMGADRADEFGRRNGVPGELLVRLHPTKVTAKFDVAD